MFYNLENLVIFNNILKKFVHKISAVRDRCDHKSMFDVMGLKPSSNKI